MLEKLYDIPEAAEALRLAQGTVRLWIRQGKLRASRVGQRRVMVRESELQRVITELEREQSQ